MFSGRSDVQIDELLRGKGLAIHRACGCSLQVSFNLRPLEDIPTRSHNRVTGDLARERAPHLMSLFIL